ncbi:MAG: virulence protein E [Treponema sp.]|nr:virulence protein E [Treponema sp.]
MRKVSVYKSPSDTISQNWADFDDVLYQIQHSPLWIEKLTQELNILYYQDKKAYKKRKKALPLFSASGCLTYRNGDIYNLLEYSDLLILDFDWENPEPRIIEEFKQKLIHYATPLHLYAIWKSPAKGVKAALIHDNTNPVYHTELFYSVKDNLFPNTPQYDMSGQDLSRTCFICHDSDLFINRDPGLQPYHFVHSPDFKLPSSSGSTHTSYGQFQHTPQEIERNRWYQLVCTDKTLMNKMIRQFNAANPNYNIDGNRHSEVLRRATLYCKNGILYENAVISLVGQFGEKSRAGLKDADIRSMVNSCYNKARQEFGTGRANYLNFKKVSI